LKADETRPIRLFISEVVPGKTQPSMTKSCTLSMFLLDVIWISGYNFAFGWLDIHTSFCVGGFKFAGGDAKFVENYRKSVASSAYLV